MQKNKNIFPSALAENIRILVLDVDGVLTDAGLYYDKEGQSMKRFNTQDGLGIKLALSCDIKIAVITGLKSIAVATRIKELKIEDYFEGFLDKRDCLEKIRSKYSFDWKEMAYLGDDWVDLSVMKMVGLPIAVSNAQPEVKQIAKFITEKHGGHGAVREVIRHILISQKKYEHILSVWSNPC